MPYDRNFDRVERKIDRGRLHARDSVGELLSNPDELQEHTEHDISNISHRVLGRMKEIVVLEGMNDMKTLLRERWIHLITAKELSELTFENCGEYIADITDYALSIYRDSSDNTYSDLAGKEYTPKEMWKEMFKFITNLRLAFWTIAMKEKYKNRSICNDQRYEHNKMGHIKEMLAAPIVAHHPAIASFSYAATHKDENGGYDYEAELEHPSQPDYRKVGIDITTNLTSKVIFTRNGEVTTKEEEDIKAILSGKMHGSRLPRILLNPNDRDIAPVCAAIVQGIGYGLQRPLDANNPMPSEQAIEQFIEYYKQYLLERLPQLEYEGQESVQNPVDRGAVARISAARITKTISDDLLRFTTDSISIRPDDIN